MLWSLVLDEDYLFTGDSEGTLAVWDPTFGTLVKRFNHLQADITTMCFSRLHKTLYATGVDSRILAIKLVQRASTEEEGVPKSEEWVHLGLFRG